MNEWKRESVKMKNASDVVSVGAWVNDNVVRERKVYTPELFFLSF
jgi:hypothetical protein